VLAWVPETSPSSSRSGWLQLTAPTRFLFNCAPPHPLPALPSSAVPHARPRWARWAVGAEGPRLRSPGLRAQPAGSRDAACEVTPAAGRGLRGRRAEAISVAAPELVPWGFRGQRDPHAPLGTAGSPPRAFPSPRLGGLPNSNKKKKQKTTQTSKNQSSYPDNIYHPQPSQTPQRPRSARRASQGSVLGHGAARASRSRTYGPRTLREPCASAAWQQPPVFHSPTSHPHETDFHPWTLCTSPPTTSRRLPCAHQPPRSAPVPTPAAPGLHCDVLQETTTAAEEKRLPVPSPMWKALTERVKPWATRSAGSAAQFARGEVAGQRQQRWVGGDASPAVLGASAGRASGSAPTHTKKYIYTHLVLHLYIKI